MISEQKPPSVLQLSWVLVVVLAFAGLMFRLDWNMGYHGIRLTASDLVGAWVVNFGGIGTCKELRADGTYTEVEFGAGRADPIHRGHWSVQGDFISWDASPDGMNGYALMMYNASEDRFTTVVRSTEMNSPRTVYERLPGLGARCTATALAEFTS